MNYCDCCGQYTDLIHYVDKKAHVDAQLCQRCLDDLLTIQKATSGDAQSQRGLAAVRNWYRHIPKEA